MSAREPTHERRVHVDADDSAGELLRQRLRELVAKLRSHDSGVRTGDPHDVHQMRVAARELRTVLVTFRPWLDHHVTDPLRTELRWLADTLAPARDLGVQRRLLLEMLDELSATDPQAVHGPVRTRVEAELCAGLDRARLDAAEALRSDRYAVLVDRLGRLAAVPPLSVQAHQAVRVAGPARVRKEWERLRGAAARADDAAADQRLAALHEVRKAAKRARYAAETLVPVNGNDARRFAGAMKCVQTILGDHRDAVLCAGLLRDIAARARAKGEDGFTYGVLYARALDRAASQEQRYEQVRRRADLKKLRRWLG